MRLGQWTAKAKAKEFLIWRAGQSVNWECTVRELASETGLTEATVQTVLKRKGWDCRVDGRSIGNFGAHQREITYWIHD